MKNIIFTISIMGFAMLSYGQNLLYLDDVEVSIDNTTTIHVEGGVVLQNQSRFDNDGTIHVGSSGSGFSPANANWVNNNASEPGNNFVANGHVRLLMDGARITGTLAFPDQAYFNHLWLDAPNGINWMDIDFNFSRGLHLGSATLEVNNQSLTVGNVDPSVIDASGGGAIRLESVLPLPGANQWSLLQWGTDSAPQLYSLPLKSPAGSDFTFTFSTQASTFPQFVAVSTYATGQNNLPLPEDFYGAGPVNDADINGDGTDDSDNMVDRYWMIWSPNKSLGTLEFQMPAAEASTGNLTPATSLSAFYYDSDWNFPGSGSGDGLIGVNVPVNSTLIRTYALASQPVLLPIECVDFSGTLKFNTVKLEWKTLSETNNHGFELQRSLDGISFETIKWIDGAGNSSATNFYTIDDYRINGNNTYYYRLFQVDFDGGRNQACNIVSVETDDISVSTKPMIYPNPAYEETTLRVPEEYIGNNVQITNVIGQIVRQFELLDVISTIYKSDLSPGTYFVTILNPDSGNEELMKLIFID